MNAHIAKLCANHQRVVTNCRRVLEDHSRVLEDHSRVLEDHSRVPKNHWRVVTNYRRVLENHSRVLENHLRVSKNLLQIQNFQKKVKRRIAPRRANSFNFHVPANYQVLEEFLTAKSKKSNNFPYKVSFSFPYLRLF
jgi:hypothetical protein